MGLNPNKDKIGWCDYTRGWIEGVIDGEGSLSLIREKRPNSKAKYTYKPILSIGNKDINFLLFAKRIIGGGRIGKCRKSGVYEYVMTSNLLRDFLPKIQLIIKEKQRELLLEVLEIYDRNHTGRGGYFRESRIIKRLVEIHDKMRCLNGGWLNIEYKRLKQCNAQK